MVSYVTGLLRDYPAGGMADPFLLDSSVTGWGLVQAGDGLLCTVTNALNGSTDGTPPAGAIILQAMNSDPGIGAVSSTVFWYEVPSPKPSSIPYEFTAPRRGAFAAVAYRRDISTQAFHVDSLASSPLWVPAGPTGKAIPRVVTTHPNAKIACVIGQDSGSGAISATGYTLRTDSAQRDGAILTRNTDQVTPGQIAASTATVSLGQSHQIVTVGISEITPPATPIVASLESETYPGFTGDVADGAAIYPNGSDSLILATNKATGGGLYVLGLDGQIVSSTLGFAANSVDWRAWDGGRILVMTVDRDTNQIKYFWLNPATKTLTVAGTTTLAYEPYGSCLYVHSNGNVYAFISDRGADDFGTHSVRQYLLTRSGETVSAGSVVRTITADGVMEGMAADDATGVIFVSREDHGLYRYSAAPGGSTTPTTVDTVGAGNLVADVEDVAIARHADGDKLLVSSQGDSSYHVYNLATLAHEQRFTIARPGGSTSVLDTDGLDVLLTPMGDFTDGLIVVHDGGRTPTSGFAFVDAALVFGPLPVSDFPFQGYGHALLGNQPVVAIHVGANRVWP